MRPPAAAPAPGRSLVAIDGIDGSGKSTLADWLMEALAADGVAAIRLRVDDFRRPVDWARTDRTELDLYYDAYYDLVALDACLRAFLEGAVTLRYVVHDLAAGSAATREVTVGDASLAVVEGVFVRRLASVLASAAVIEVRTSRAEARRRILARDIARGRTAEDVAHRIDARYFPAQDRYRAALATDVVDVVIDGEQPGAGRLLRLDDARMPAAVARALRRRLDRSPG